MSRSLKRAKLLVQGTVQAVGFRPFVYRLAHQINVTGSVKNLGNAGVEIEIEGSKNKIQEFVDRLGNENPPLSKIRSIKIEYYKPKGTKKFQILKSEERGDERSGTIPPDAAICEKCLNDIQNPQSRYHGYWATSCVNCGPRYTIIKSIPYDRPRTSMDDFPMCDECKAEYEDPRDRRYHAQTIACPNCGPSLVPHPPSEEPIQKARKVLKEDGIVAIKGIGGTHISCNAYSNRAVIQLKENLSRPYQPLAIMAENLEKIREFAKVEDREKEELTSFQRPIVILNQLEESPLSEEVAEGLHNIGVMLPYTGLHYLLFEGLDFPIVMTSANMPGNPMLINNDRIKSKFREIVDFMLLHNRKIVSRCDDSVVRFSGGTRKFLRRSRGWAPSPIPINSGGDSVLALGAELDNTVAIFDGENCYISQYVGDVDNLETLEYLEKTIGHLTKVANLTPPEKIACDLHPDFLTTEIAEAMSDSPVRVQHHHAHVAGALVENDLEEAVGIAADGIGYGSDETIWGGEIIHATTSDFERVGHLSQMLMPGGDKATEYPSRMIAGIFYESSELEEILKKHCKLPGGDKERELVQKQTQNKFNSPETTSAGRFLDAVSSLLNVCQKRTYEGEPAMRLESFSIGGNPLGLEPKLKESEGRTVLDVQHLMRKLIEYKETGENRKNIAATAQESLAKGLGNIAVKYSEDLNIEDIIMTGGVTYNNRISNRLRKTVENEGLRYHTNKLVPPGDGGISFGQVIVAKDSS